MFSENPTSIPHVGLHMACASALNHCGVPPWQWLIPSGALSREQRDLLFYLLSQKGCNDMNLHVENLTDKRPFHTGGNSNIWEELNVCNFTEKLFSLSHVNAFSTANYNVFFKKKILLRRQKRVSQTFGKPQFLS